MSWCYGSSRVPPAAHEVTSPLSADHLCLSCEVNLSHDLDLQEGIR
jgi:hypothetical protein